MMIKTSSTSLLKVLKGVIEYTDLTLGDLLEGIMNAFARSGPKETIHVRE